MGRKRLVDCRDVHLEWLRVSSDEGGQGVDPEVHREAVAACRNRLMECEEELTRFLDRPLRHRLTRLFGEDLATEATQEAWLAILTWARANHAKYLRFLTNACARDPVRYLTRFAIFCARRIRRDHGRDAEHGRTYGRVRRVLLESKARESKDAVLKAAIDAELSRSIVDAAFTAAIDGVLTTHNKRKVVRELVSFFAELNGSAISTTAAILGVSESTVYSDIADFFALVYHEMLARRSETAGAGRAERA